MARQAIYKELCMSLKEEWRKWADENRPQNEEAFWICWNAAWEAAGKEYRDYIKLLKEEVGFAERGYTKMGKQ